LPRESRAFFAIAGFSPCPSVAPPRMPAFG
jgi:hypothetical protein